jgi:hypothetical protein
MPQLATTAEISVETINGTLSRLLAIKRSEAKLVAKTMIASKVAEVVPLSHHLWLLIPSTGFLRIAHDKA